LFRPMDRVETVVPKVGPGVASWMQTFPELPLVEAYVLASGDSEVLHTRSNGE